MAHRHHLAVGGGRRHLEHVRHRRRRERVVPAGLERLVGSPAKMPAPVVATRSSPCRGRASAPRPTVAAEHRARSPGGRGRRRAPAPGRRTRAPIASETPALSGRPGPGRDHDVRRRQPLGLLDRDLVVPPHHHLRPELAEQVRQVVRERVVVVDQEQHQPRLRELDRALDRGELVQALLVLGGRVGVGDEPAARLQVGDAVVQEHRPQRDAGVERRRRGCGTRPRRRRSRAGTPRAPR